MRYLFIFLIFVGVNLPAYAWGPKFGSNDSCIAEYKSTHRYFYFCGQNTYGSCAGKNVMAYSRVYKYDHQDTRTTKNHSRKFWCCNPNNDVKGIWKEGDSWYTTDTIETKELPNGSCQYRKLINICGIDETVECTVPDECNPGTILRNNACVAPCDGTTAFASKTSNECIECETTAYQGIDHTANECVRCDEATQFFDKITKKCISKTSLNRLDATAIKTEKHLYDHILYDSSNERDFAKELEIRSEVAVYVKLPNGFYISTPVGHYNPDWVIAFYEGSVKHIYFVAETKGSLDSMNFNHITPIEQAKIDCAREHFKAISSGDAVYDVVDGYQALLDKVMR